MKIYLIGSLRNPRVPFIGSELRQAGFDVFDDWFAAGPQADDCLWAYEQGRSHSCAEALTGYAAQHIFAFDKWHLERADVAVLIMPAGKSAFLELGIAVGQGKWGYILLDKEPERIDIMFQFAHGVTLDMAELLQWLGGVNGR